MRRRSALRTLWQVALGLGAMSGARAQRWDVLALRSQLQRQTLSRGDFVQEKYLRGLAQPLRSSGRYVLVRGLGLLWLLRSPVQQDYRMTAQGVARRQNGQWQALNNGASSVAAQQNRLFMAVLAGDDQALAQQFELHVSGHADAWLLELKPRSALLAQIFSVIRIAGGAQVMRIELLETQGDRTLIRLQPAAAPAQLDDAEQQALSHG